LRFFIAALLFVFLIFGVFWGVDYLEDKERIVYSNIKIEKNLPYLSKRYEILYFGYSSCTDICAPRLKEISTLIDELNSTEIGFRFITLDKNEERGMATLYAKIFNEKIEGVSFSEDNLRLSQQLRVSFEPSLKNGSTYYHSDFLYLLENRDGEYFLVATFLGRRIDIGEVRKIIGYY